MKYLIVGLGNPGEQYNETRHNIGFKVLDALAEQHNTVFKPSRFGLSTEIKWKARTYTLLKPDTFMNLSGNAARFWLQKLKLQPENMMIVVDDLNIDLGKIRIRGKGSDGGHNGLKSLQQELNTTAYPRLRFGIGNEYSKGGQINFVLGKWNPDEIEPLEKAIKKAGQACLDFGFIGLPRTMNQYNG